MMMTIVSYVIWIAVLFAVELIYFKVADRFNIIDKPNERSSHVKPTIRGGGIIFFISILIWFLLNEFQWPWFMMGITVIALVSFLDDLKPRPAVWRFSVHLIAVLMIFYQLQLFNWPWWFLVLALIVCIGALNAFNFMDGINGITGIYGLMNLGSFIYIQKFVIAFTSETLLFASLLPVIVFLFFNFRKRAACFAGDVGSITLALIEIFFLLQLIHTSGNLIWVLFFSVYGFDSIITICYRLAKRENIFKPHRTHLYQYLSNELNGSHTTVSLLYGVIQLIMNGILVYSFLKSDVVLPLTAAFVLLITYLWLRRNTLIKIRTTDV